MDHLGGPLLDLLAKFWYGVAIPVIYWIFRVESRMSKLETEAANDRESAERQREKLYETLKEYREDIKEIRSDIKKLLTNAGNSSG